MLTNDQLVVETNKHKEQYLRMATKEYDCRISRLLNTNDFLETKKFKLGQAVVVSCFEKAEGEADYKWVDRIGVVCGHGIPDGHDDYYRIHFTEKDDFSAEREEKIRALNDNEEIPEHLKTHTWHWSVGSYVSPIGTIATFK